MHQSYYTVIDYIPCAVHYILVSFYFFLVVCTSLLFTCLVPSLYPSSLLHLPPTPPNYLILHITVKITFSKPKALIRSTCPSWKSITLRLKTQVLNTASRVYNGLPSGLLSYHTFHLLHSVATLVFLTHRLCTCPSLIHSANISWGIIIC